MGEEVPTVAAAARQEYESFSRVEWSRLRDHEPVPLSSAELEELGGVGVRLSLEEVADVYLPLVRLLELEVAQRGERQRRSEVFLRREIAATPFVLGIAGSVAAGKSTTARLLRTLLARNPIHPDVALVPTDGFLYPNRELERRGLMERKGFPESYDLPRLVDFLAGVKGGKAPPVPVYSHLVYDILPGEELEIGRPDILILEGLNVLQAGQAARRDVPRVLVSDFFDLSLYVHAAEKDLRTWFVRRFLEFRETAFHDPASYFRRVTSLSVEESVALADDVWTRINAVNLHENIEPTRERADLIIEKGADHAVERVRVRKK
ncbi:type I pantothenate kinase [soil metagenome]